MEGAQLQVKDVELDQDAILIRERKGSKDRIVMRSQTLRPPLQGQIAHRHYGRLIGKRSYGNLIKVNSFKK